MIIYVLLCSSSAYLHIYLNIIKIVLKNNNNNNTLAHRVLLYIHIIYTAKYIYLIVK